MRWLAITGIALAACREDIAVPVPHPGDVHMLGTATVADNGLTAAEAEQFYGLSEGSGLFPLSWFLHMDSDVTGRPFRENLDRFGLLRADRPKDRWNLPVGLTVNRPADVGVNMLGVNCAACHVGEIVYGNGTRLRIHGAPNLFDIQAFYNELVSSALTTLKQPTRLVALLFGGEDGEPVDVEGLAMRVTGNVAGIGRAVSDVSALRAEGGTGAVLADEIAAAIDAEVARFDA